MMNSFSHVRKGNIVSIGNILFILYILSSFVFGGLLLGAYSLRIYSALILVLFLLFKRTSKFFLSREVLLYILFILFQVISLLVTDDFLLVDFPKYFLSRYLLCFIMIYAFHNYIKSKREYMALLKLLLFIGGINATVTIMQSLGIHASYLLAGFLRSDQTKYAIVESGSSVLGIGAPGIFGNIVSNGYYSSIFVLTSLGISQEERKNRSKYFRILISGVLYYTLFLTQQRFVFIATTFVITIFFFRRYRFKAILVSLLISAIFIFTSLDISKFDFGRILLLSDIGRLRIYGLSLQFIKDHFLFGGRTELATTFESSGISVSTSHNVFLLAFVYSGLFGGIVIIWLYFRMMRQAVAIIIKHFNDSLVFFIAAAFIIYQLNSIFHNSSLVTGDEVIWLLYFLTLKLPVSKVKGRINK